MGNVLLQIGIILIGLAVVVAVVWAVRRIDRAAYRCPEGLCELEIRARRNDHHL